MQNHLDLWDYDDRPSNNLDNEWVEVDGVGSGSLATRFTAGVDQNVLDYYDEGNVGEVIGGPLHRHAYVWWRVAWYNGTIGWSVQRHLKETSAPTQDTTPPVITRLGDSMVDIPYGASYTDAGATAWDDVDGTITAAIVTTGLPIDTTDVGQHYVWYNVSDAAGNEAQAKARIVTVLPEDEPLPPDTASATVFDDALGSGWYDDSYGATVSATDGHLSVVYTQQYGEFTLLSSPFDTTGHNTFSFKINPRNAEAQQLYVHLFDASGNPLWSAHVYVPHYVVGGVLTPDVWHEVHIPLADLAGSETTITGVTFMHDATTTVSFDDIRFETTTTPDTGVCNEY